MVCIAVKGRPIIGVIHKPFLKINPTSWAWVNVTKSPDLTTKLNRRGKLKIIISRSHSGDIRKVLDENLKEYELVVAAGAGI